jgi:NhaP-type Na+/H+ or K+/H+ antiporter
LWLWVRWQAGYVSNTLIFFVSGLIMAERGLRSPSITEKDWWYMLVLYVVMNLARLVGVAAAFPIFKRGPYGIDWKQGLVLSGAGLRGAVGLVLAIAIHQERRLPQSTRDQILFMVAGTILLTLVINGTSLGPIITLLKLNKVRAPSPSPSRCDRYKSRSHPSAHPNTGE